MNAMSNPATDMITANFTEKLRRPQRRWTCGMLSHRTPRFGSTRVTFQ
jgi:hypothetical protein